MLNKTLIDNLNESELLAKVAEYTQQNYTTRAELIALKKEIESSEKLLGIKAEPQAILDYKNKLEKTMRTSLKNIEALEQEILKKEEDTSDEINRQWVDEIAKSEEDTNAKT